jgi:hypothetical protein
MVNGVPALQPHEISFTYIKNTKGLLAHLQKITGMFHALIIASKIAVRNIEMLFMLFLLSVSCVFIPRLNLFSKILNTTKINYNCNSIQHIIIFPISLSAFILSSHH